MRRGSPRLAENQGERCQALTIETEWKRENKADLQCPFFARLELNGKRLCNRHGELEAVATLLADGKAKRIAQPAVRLRYGPVPVVTAKE
jgi:hypothetical protein